MDRESLRRRIRRLAFASPALSRAVMSGNFRSAFKGRGMDFDGLREYDPGDDALRMDWNATARFSKPYVKTWRDDRNLTVYLLLDESRSMDFGEGRTKRETCALAASLLAWACTLNGARVGALFFGGDDPRHQEPAAGESKAWALVGRIAAGSARSACGSGLDRALDSAMLHLKRRSLVVVMSDFMTAGWALPLARLARRHDLALVRIHDRLDGSAPPVRFAMRAVDSESGRPRLALPRSEAWKEGLASAASAARLEWLSAAAAARAPSLDLDSASDPAQAMVDFFGRRRRA